MKKPPRQENRPRGQAQPDPEESAVDIEVSSEYLEVTIDALLAEKERLSRLSRKRPWWSPLMFLIPVALRGALWAAAGVSILLIVMFVGYLLLMIGGMQPR